MASINALLSKIEEVVRLTNECKSAEKSRVSAIKNEASKKFQVAKIQFFSSTIYLNSSNLCRFAMMNTKSFSVQSILSQWITEVMLKPTLCWLKRLFTVKTMVQLDF